MKLSIIVPVYNMAADGKLEFCLDSLVCQTIENYEIILVDDASTDDSLKIIKDYEAKYPKKIKSIALPKNMRQGGAKNAGLKVACGEWIGFIDSDDWVVPNYYERLLEKARDTGADMVGCDYSLVDSHTYIVGKTIVNNQMSQTGILTREKHKSLFMRPGSMVIKIYKHEIIQKNQLSFPEGIFYEDNMAGPLWSFYFSHFERVEEPLYYYYQHETSTVHYITEEKCRDRMKAASMLLKECKARGFYQEYKAEIDYRVTELYYAITLFSYMIGTKNRKLSFIKELKEGILEMIPDFRDNRFYKEYTNTEEQEMIGLHMKSDLKFFCYYGLKLRIRKIRKKFKI